MDLQKNVLNRYLELKGKPTLKEISKDTGIQITRVFRILNGSEMKLKEYGIFKEKVFELEGDSGTFLKLATKCDEFLSSKMKEQISTVMMRFLKLSSLIKSEKYVQSNVLTV